MNELTIRSNDEISPVGVIADDQIEALAAKVEKRMQAMRTIIKACIQRTNPQDWIDQNGKPYLQASGAEKLRWPLGISWMFPKIPVSENHPSQFVYEEEFLRENLPDGHFTYTLKGIFSLGGISIEAVGTRSSKDGFFKRYAGKGENRVELPPSEIDHNDVKKAALSNCIGNGITRLLGIRNMTWDELREMGLDVSKVAKVDYKQAEESGETKDLREEIRRMIKEMSAGDDNEARNLLEKFTTFVPKGKAEVDRVKGRRDIKDLTEKQISPTYGKVKEAYTEWQKKQGFKTDDVLIAVQNATTIEEVDNLLSEAVNRGVKGEAYTNIVKARDKKATEIREAQK